MTSSRLRRVRYVIAEVLRAAPSALVRFGLEMMRLPSFFLRLGVLLWCSRIRVDRDRRCRAIRIVVRRSVRSLAGLGLAGDEATTVEDLLREVAVLRRWAWCLRLVLDRTRTRSVIFSGQCYYNHWYLSRALRGLGWRARLVDWDTNAANSGHYHGADWRAAGSPAEVARSILEEFVQSLYRFDLAHFANAEGLQFAATANDFVARFGVGADIEIMRQLGIRIVHTNNGCRDGVRQSIFSRWGPVSPCQSCRWREVPSVCSDAKNRAWGEFRNRLMDVHFLLGGNHADFNADARVIEAPEIYCLDPAIWNPGLDVPDRLRLPASPKGTVRLYHAVGNARERTNEAGVNIKCTHIYLPLIEKFRQQGLSVELVAPPLMPNRDIRFIQLQSDIFLEMLTYGWFGAAAREFMMLGKPVVGFIRPEWLEGLRVHCPEYGDELPVIQATPETIEQVLRGLIEDADLRRTVGERSRAFALKWHSSEAGARFASQVYEALLAGQPLPRAPKHRRRVLHV